MVTASNLSKAYRAKRVKRGAEMIEALCDVSFVIEQGEIVGYLGPNGAGKSTTIKILCGILRPDAGQMQICGIDPTKSRAELSRRIGVVFSTRSHLWWDLTVRDSFRILSGVYGQKWTETMSFIDELGQFVEIESLFTRPVRKLSLGQRMRCEVIAGLIHGPRVAFLDEPTVGLDIVVRNSIYDLYHYMNKRYNTTILVTTHDIVDVEKLCSRVIVLDKGHKIFDGSRNALREEFSTGRRWYFQYDEKIATQDRLRQWLTDHPRSTVEEYQIVVPVESKTQEASVFEAVRQVSSPVNATLSEESLADIIRTIYGTAK